MNQLARNSVGELLREAEVFASRKQWSDAADFISAALENEDDNVDVLDKLGWYLSRAKRYSEAVEIYENLCQMEPHKAKWRYMVGYQFYDQKLWDESIEWFSKALELYPEYIKPLYRMGYALTALGREDEGAKCHENVVAVWENIESSKRESYAKDYSKARFQLGKFCLGKGQTINAERNFSEAVKYGPEDVISTMVMVNLC